MSTPAILRFDAIANLVVAVGGGVFADVVAAGLGLGSTLPVYFLAGLLAVYGVEQWLAARRPRVGALIVFAVIDVAFGVGAIAFGVLDLLEAEPWMRVLLVALGAVVTAVGVVKATFARQDRAVQTGRGQEVSS